MYSLADHAEAIQNVYSAQDTAIAADVGVLFGNYADRTDFADVLRAMMPPILQQHAQATGLLTAQWYDQLNPSSAFRAATNVDVPAEQIDKTIGWSLFAPGAATPQDRLTVASQRMVRKVGRDTAVDNAQREGVRWARYASRTACSFCRLLATRGAVYESKDTAGMNNKYHNLCRCVVTPERSSERLVIPHADEWMRQYNDARSALSDRGEPASMANIVAEMRRNESLNAAS